MSVLKLNGAARTTLVVLAMMAASSQAALASPTKLLCNLNSLNGYQWEDEPTTIELDEAQGSVVVHFGGRHDNTGFYAPAFSIGPLPATFSDDTISFSRDSQDKDDLYIINRLTGSFDLYYQNQKTTTQRTCQAARKQF